MSKIFLVDLESVPTRYTAQWKYHLPKVLEDNTGKEVVIISGSAPEMKATEGAFLNFAATNYYKAEQCQKLSLLFSEGEIKDGDTILFTDAWNPVILQVKYMRDLLGIDVKLIGFWHAGSYDPQDFLGRLIKDKRWSLNTERAIFFALDKNVFATQFHIDMFVDTVGVRADDESIMRSGFPMEYIQRELYTDVKEDLVVFPHRLAPEKQVPLFDYLASALPQYKFVVCQREGMDKQTYHATLAKAKVVFSANLQETLGIGMFEGLASNCNVLVPDRLSYTEMYEPSPFLYDDESKLKELIVDMVENFDKYETERKIQLVKQRQSFFSGNILYNYLKEL